MWWSFYVHTDATFNALDASAFQHTYTVPKCICIQRLLLKIALLDETMIGVGKLFFFFLTKYLAWRKGSYRVTEFYYTYITPIKYLSGIVRHQAGNDNLSLVAAIKKGLNPINPVVSLIKWGLQFHYAVITLCVIKNLLLLFLASMHDRLIQ